MENQEARSKKPISGFEILCYEERKLNFGYKAERMDGGEQK